MTATEEHIADALGLVEVDRLEQQFKRDVPCSVTECDKPAEWRVTTKPCGCIALLCDDCMDVTRDAWAEFHRAMSGQPAQTMRDQQCGTSFLTSEADYDAQPL